jgi:hypothetical protein
MVAKNRKRGDFHFHSTKIDKGAEIGNRREGRKETQGGEGKKGTGEQEEGRGKLHFHRHWHYNYKT